MARGAFFNDPRNFLHTIDMDRQLAFFLRTDSDRLRTASFVDGRSDLTSSDLVAASLETAIQQRQDTKGVDRLIFNCSFCGSTLLARLLDRPGTSLVLKEPKALTDLAAWKVLAERDERAAPQFDPALAFARSTLRRRFVPDEAVTVKLNNLGNSLVDRLSRGKEEVLPLFITISRLDFLRAVFRGGPERMQHAATTAWSMATNTDDGDRLVKEAINSSVSPLAKAAKLAVLARFLQVNAFHRAAKRRGWKGARVIDYVAIRDHPRESTRKAATALRLSITDREIDANVADATGRNAKEPTQAFSAARQVAMDNEIHAEHGDLFETALEWGEETLGPQVEVASPTEPNAP